MGDALNMDMKNLKLQNGITLEELSSGSEFELPKDDTFYEITEDSRLNKEEFDQIYKSDSVVEEEELNQVDLASTSFQQIAKSMKDISHDGGVLKKLIKRGYGPLVAKDSVVDVHYNAYFEYSDGPFDSSHLRNESFKYKMGSNRGIPAWEMALLTMSKGEKSRFLIRPDYGFGETGCPPRVPQNATALFVIQLLNICEQVGINDFYLLNEDDRRNVTFDQINKLIHSEKLQGSKFFGQNLFKKAFNKYKQSANLLETCHLKSDEEEKESRRVLISLYLNMALCSLRLSHSTRAITLSRKVLNLDRNNAKALFRLGQAFHQLKQFDDAKQYLRKAKQILPNDSCIHKELKQVEENQKKFQFMEIDIYKKMISSIETQKKETSTPVSPVENENENESERTECDAISKEFQDSVIKYLQGFVDDKCQDECPLPTYSMSEAEMNFVLETVDNMGLYVIQTGSGQDSSIQITKSKQHFREDQVLLS